MVGSAWIGLAAALLAGPSLAADWTSAGGALFVGDAPVDIPAERQEREPFGLSPTEQPFDDAVRTAADRHGLDPKLLHALVVVESAYRSHAMSPAGAAGLTQLMPATAQELGVVDRFDPEANLSGGAEYLAQQLIRFGDLRLAIAAFNAGPSRVQQAGGVPKIAETEDFVDDVVECFLALSAGRSVTSSRECRRKVEHEPG